MRTTRSIFQSKVARRIFLLFILSSLIPVGILAALSFNQVRNISIEQVQERLKKDAKFYGLFIFDRLKIVEEELLLHASMLDIKPPITGTRNAGHLSEWSVTPAKGDGISTGRRLSFIPAFDNGAMAHMRAGGSVLSLDHQGQPPSLFMSRMVGSHDKQPRILSARIDANFLWGNPDRFSEDISACILDASFSYLHCSNTDLHPVGKSIDKTEATIRIDVEGAAHDKELLMGRWVLFLQPHYYLPRWNIFLFEDKEQAFTQLRGFSGIYAIVILLTILFVVLFSVHLIRRNTVPLEALLQGIRKLSGNNFNARVQTDSNDEYKEVANAFNRMTSQIGKQMERLKTQASIDRVILSRPSQENIVVIALEGLNHVIANEEAALALLQDASSHAFEFQHKNSVDDNNTPIKHLTLDEKQFELIQKGEPIVIDASSHLLSRNLGQGELPECAYYLLLPIVDVDTLFGMFVLSLNRKPRQEEIESGMEFGNRIAVAFSNAEWEEKLYKQARFDALTGLANRVAMEERLAQEISHAERVGEYLTVLFLDLDRFKNVNDSLGHAYGDVVLKQVSSRLSKELREGDIVARLGGDEFVILLHNLKDPKNAVAISSSVAEKIIRLITQPIILDNHEIRITTCIGISVYPIDATDVNTLLRNADSAMYHAKDMGRDNFQFYSENLNAAAHYRLTMETRLRQAIENEEFELYYQPKVDIESQSINGCEALLRWRDKDGNFTSPGDFISVAEDIGLTTVIGEWALKIACKQAKKWSLKISVNISAKHFHHGKLVEQVSKALGETKLNPKYLDIEITETTTMQKMERTISILKALKEIGVTISIDDFGTGYSSLSYLKHFPVDTLKLDRSFILNILQDEKDLAIVKSTIGLGHNLGLSVIAEGVEKEAQKEQLAAMGCDEIQGFLYSPALPAKDFEQLLTKGFRPSC